MPFGLALDSADVDLLDTDLGLQDTDIPSKHFVCLQDVLKTSSRHVFKTSFKMSSRRLGRRKIVKLKTYWRHLQDMSWRRLEDQKMFAGFEPLGFLLLKVDTDSNS